MKLLVTLGSETAAVIHDADYGAINRRAKQLFYQDPVRMTVFGRPLKVVHLAHPGLLMTKPGREAGWREIHEQWCRGPGRAILAGVTGDRTVTGSVVR